MPKIEKASDLVSAAAALTEATATGELTPGEASDLRRLVEVTAKAIEVNSLAERIERLEQQLSKGGNP
jgi:polyhydroxyalkanoate synthesis regulator phasin